MGQRGAEAKEWRKVTWAPGGGLHAYLPRLYVDEGLEEAGIPMDAQLEMKVIGVKAEHRSVKLVIELRRCPPKEDEKWLI